MSKEKSPSFQVYPSDYLSDVNTQLMTIEEEGCYWRLMMFCWREECLPSDSARLTLLCKGIVPSEKVIGCFIAVRSEADPGAIVLRHKRLDAERKKQSEFREEKSRAGQIGNKIRWGKHKKRQKKIAVGSLCDVSAIANGSQTIALQSSICNLQSSTSQVPSAPSSAEPSNGNGSAPKPVITIPTNAGSEYPIFQDALDEYRRLYPGVDVMQQLRSMRGWSISNPTKRKTKSGMPRFINGWLDREQNKASAGHAPPLPSPGHRYDGLNFGDEEEDAIQPIAPKG